MAFQLVSVIEGKETHCSPPVVKFCATCPDGQFPILPIVLLDTANPALAAVKYRLVNPSGSWSVVPIVAEPNTTCGVLANARGKKKSSSSGLSFIVFLPQEFFDCRVKVDFCYWEVLVLWEFGSASLCFYCDSGFRFFGCVNIERDFEANRFSGSFF